MQVKTNNIKTRSFLFSKDLLSFLRTIQITLINRSIIDQLLRSGLSIGANIIEAQGASSNKDFINYLCISSKSSHETKYWLYLIFETENSNTNKEKIKEFIKENDEINKMISASIVTLKKKSNKQK